PSPRIPHQITHTPSTSLHPKRFGSIAPYERKRRRGTGFAIPVIDAYLANPPARRPEARVIRGRDDAYLPTSWAFIHDAQVVKRGYVGWL
ncbi:hypothetical protein, partial [uncultured Streptomyces sp.]|uniref:hypothetical protein n=1 Tax=uncultured Streptomyces sp. TaxID=174707 RepID=UPI00260C7679